MPIAQFVLSVLCVVLHFLSGLSETDWLDRRSGMFCLLLSQEILPYSWVGSCLYVFTSYDNAFSMKSMDWFLNTIPVVSGALNMTYFWMRGEVRGSEQAGLA